MREDNLWFNAALKKAIDYVHREWQHKAAYDVVSLPFVAQFLNEDREFVPDDVVDAAAPAMLDGRVRWTEAMGALRG